MFKRIRNRIGKLSRMRTNAKQYAQWVQDSQFGYFLRLYNRCKVYGKKYADSYDDIEQILSELLVVSHTIEKGLTMPNVRLGFGTFKIQKLISLLDAALSSKEKHDERVGIALRTLNRYVELHKNEMFAIDSNIQEKCELFNEQYSLDKSTIRAFDTMATIQNEGKGKDLSFFEFAKQRHSSRSFAENRVDEKIIREAISLAQTSPSTCNRQSTKVLHIVSPGAIQQILSVQGGCRGYESNIKTLLVVYSDLRDWDGGADFSGPYIDGGIFIMNLLYALHYYQIGACTLNAYFSEEAENEFREITQLNEYEVPVALIACGAINGEVAVPLSEKRKFEDIYTQR